MSDNTLMMEAALQQYSDNMEFKVFVRGRYLRRASTEKLPIQPSNEFILECWLFYKDNPLPPELIRWEEFE